MSAARRFRPLGILDLYALRFFFSSYLICFVTLVLLILLGDTFDKLDRFLSAKTPWWRALPRYYAGQIPLIVERFAAFVTLAGAMFAVARLERNNEILPMKAGGISIFRAMAPILAAATLLGGISILDTEIAIPQLADLIRETTRYEKRSAIRPGILRDAAGNTLYAEAYEPAERRLHWVSFREYDPAGRELRAWHAETATWVPTKGRRGYWLLEDGVVREARESAPREVPAGGPPRVEQQRIGRGRPRDPAAPGKSEGRPIATTIRPIDIESLGERVSLLSFQDLRDQFKRQSYLLRLHVQIHARIAAPLAHPILCLLGLPFVLRASGRRSVFFGVLALIAICAAFFVTNFIFQDLGSDGVISPMAAVWVPTVAFALLGIALFARVPT
jgi:lipopolysaccharide export system permease protein